MFLYSRLPDYFFRCMEYFVNAYDAKVVVIRYRDDPNTQYAFNTSSNLQLVFKDEIDVGSFVEKVAPDVIILSNWNDKQYTAVCKRYIRRIPVVLALDNPYTGSAKQKILTMLAPLTINAICNKAWVAGPAQYEYARRLGYKSADILLDLYSANDPCFREAYTRRCNNPAQQFAKRILYVGRLVAYKQADILASVFNELSAANNEWTLIIAGEGPLKETLRAKNYRNVQLISFISPSELPGFYEQGGVFCLPSQQEHWGVAVHEAGLAGLPLLLSDSVHSAATFLKHGYNGYAFKTNDRNSLKIYLEELMNKDAETLNSMGSRSVSLATRISKATWAASLNSVFTPA